MATTADSTWTKPPAEDGTGSERWTAPDSSPLTVVAHDVRVRYQAPRTDRTPPPTLRGRLMCQRMVYVAAVRGVSFTARSGAILVILFMPGSGNSPLPTMLS